jgi:hypothetical protein
LPTIDSIKLQSIRLDLKKKSSILIKTFVYRFLSWLIQSIIHGSKKSFFFM